MSVLFPRVNRTWSIADFRQKAHTQPKAPDASGTPAFPDGIFNDLLAEVSLVLSSIQTLADSTSANAAAVEDASVLLAALSAVAPSLSTATYNAVFLPNAAGTGYSVHKWSSFAASAALAAGTHRILFDTSGGPFKITLTGTPAENDLIEVADLARTFNANNGTLVFNATIAGSIYVGTTVIFDVAGDHAYYQFISGLWREL